MDNISADAIMRQEIVRKLRERYTGIHNTLFVRSVEKAATPAVLFDMLDTAPGDYPLRWNDKTLRWEVTKLF